MIYFVQPADNPDHIKIGFTSCLTERLKGLGYEYGSAVSVLGVMDGDFREERSLHWRFRHIRIERERFKVVDELLDFIAEHAKPWDESSDRGLRSLVSLKGTDEYEAWLDGLVEHFQFGTRSLLIRNALRVIAEQSGFKEPQPKR